MSEIKSPWKDYWQSYGDYKAVFSSGYFWGAFLGAIIASPLICPELRMALQLEIEINKKWYDFGIAILPDMLGFTLAGYTVLFAFSDKGFITSLMGPYRNQPTMTNISPYKELNASLVHFIVVQVIALVVSVIGSAWGWQSGVLAFLGLWLFSYAIATALATTMGIFRLSRIIEHHTMNQNE